MSLRTLAAGLVAVLLVLVAPIAGAQTADEIDYDAWGSVAGRAEASIEAARASSQAFESLRSEIVVWRERFLRVQDVNSARIETLKTQIEALGEPPGEGGTEADEIATRRFELGEQLVKAQAPVTRAEEAFSRAGGLVREIDKLIRERQTDALLRLGPTPLNPAHWPPALVYLTGSLRAILTESRDAWSSEIKLNTLRHELPRTLLLLVVAALLLLRGQAIMGRISERVLRATGSELRRAGDFLLSLGQVAMPVAGIYLLVIALNTSGLLGFRGSLVVGWLPYLGFCVYGAYWLGQRLLPKGGGRGSLLVVNDDEALRMRAGIAFLGFLVGLSGLLAELAEYEGYSETSTAVLLFPVALLAGLALFRLGRLLTAKARKALEQEDHAYLSRWMGLLGRIVAVLAMLGVVLAAVGFLNAGLYLLFPTVKTLALLALLHLLNSVVRFFYGLATGSAEEEVQAALLPTLLGFVLVLVSLPFFALTWGARRADLTELWAEFREGFALGETRISPENFLTFVLVFVALYLATRIVQGALRNNVLPKTQIDPGGQTAIVSGLGYIGIFFAALVAITAAGINLTSLALVAGALSVGIGFGLQNIVQNFVSGIILLIERPVAEGDWIQVGGHTGIVRRISVRSTLIETFDRNDVIVPNGDFIAGAVSNWTRTNNIGRIKVQVGVAYGNDTRRIAEILKEIAEEHPLVTVDPAPGIDFRGFGADSLDFQIRAVLSDVNFSMSVKTELNHRIAERFAEEGIEIPFAQRDIWLRNPEALRQATPGPLSPASSERELHLGEADKELDPDQTAQGDEADY
ncbi:MAG: DUF3772 domain-containing protein [Rhodobacteraceae bacterium]|nr:DUF3772 domain-containing protein [Paracoccaceae bacterium]